MKKRLCILLALLMSLSLALNGCQAVQGVLPLDKAKQEFQNLFAFFTPKAPDPLPFLTTYLAHLNQRDFGSCYAMLTASAQQDTALADYSQRHILIFDAIALELLTASFATPVEKSAGRYAVDATLTYDSAVLGPFPAQVQFVVDYNEETSEFHLNWGPEMIFDGLSQKDTVRLRTLRPARGEILDSDHNTYAVNGYAETVYLRLSRVTDMGATISSLSTLLGLAVKDIEKAVGSERAKADDVAIIKAYPPGTLTQEKENALCALEGVGVDRETYTPIRYYPNGTAVAHAVGYVSPIEESELATLDQERYDISSYVGRTGLEAAYEDILTGTKGYSLDIYTADGQRKSTVAKLPAQDGLDLEITIDLDLQQRAEALLPILTTENAGSVVVLNPKTGDVLAMASYPNYNPNLMAFSSDPDTVKAYSAKESNSPFLNRAARGTYPPGSTIKPLIAALALENQLMSPEDEFPGHLDETGYYWTPKSWGEWIYPPIKRAARYGGRAINMSNAITNSDNIYFAYVALKAGWGMMEPFLQRIGFNENIPFDFSVTKTSYLKNGNYDNLRLLADTGYGQGELITSPLQMAAIFSSFANGGDVMEPRLVKATRIMREDEYVPVNQKEPSVWKSGIITSSAISTIEPMLQRVVEEGTGEQANIPGLTICGKTGTAEIGSNKKREIAWYIAYLQDADYDRLVCVTLETPANYDKDSEYNLKSHLVHDLLMP